jgi:hypothetical protein
MDEVAEDTSAAGYEISDGDRARIVVNTLGSGFTAYAIKMKIDWDEIAKIYGERFRDGKLYHFPGTSEYDDSSYYMAGETWVIAAADVTNPGRVIAECMMEEIRGLRSNPKSPISDWDSRGTVGLSDYFDVCDSNLLHRNGIIFAFKQEDDDSVYLDDVWDYLEGDEREEVEELISWQ